VEDLIFLDESGVNLAMVRLYARALKGKRARGEKPQKRGRNISLISALSLRKVVASVNIYGAVDGVTFEAFVLNKLVPNLWENACVVMDNAKIHQGEIVREFIEKAGATLLYLSPYSPEFSPIENFWSKVKSILRKTAARTYKGLIDAIANAMLNVTQENIRNWFAHCCRLLNLPKVWFLALDTIAEFAPGSSGQHFSIAHESLLTCGSVFLHILDSLLPCGHRKNAPHC